MNLDPTTWVLALSGAGLLVAGGAVLRGGDSSKDEAARRQAELEAEVERWRARAERAGFEASRELDQVEARASDAERELAAAGDLIEGLKREVAAERALAASVETSATELRTKLRQAEEATRAAVERADAAETAARAKAQPSTPPPVQTTKTNTVPPPADPALRREVDHLKSQLASLTADRDRERQRAASLVVERDAATAALSAAKASAAPAPSLAAVTAERDAAREKVEALERLVDGVRARSRELAAELKELKSKLPPT